MRRIGGWIVAAGGLLVVAGTCRPWASSSLLTIGPLSFSEGISAVRQPVGVAAASIGVLLVVVGVVGALTSRWRRAMGVISIVLAAVASWTMWELLNDPVGPYVDHVLEALENARVSTYGIEQSIRDDLASGSHVISRSDGYWIFVAGVGLALIGGLWLLLTRKPSPDMPEIAPDLPAGGDRASMESETTSPDPAEPDDRLEPDSGVEVPSPPGQDSGAEQPRGPALGDEWSG
jgi:hypothetical protein